MMTEYLICVPLLPPDPVRVHWSVVSKAKKQWHRWVWGLAQHAGVPACQPGERRAVRVVMYRPGPRSDVDNAARRLKVVLDALVRAGLIEDDRPACVTVTWDTEPAPAAKTRTEIIITI